MKVSSPILAVWLASFLVTGCGINRAESLRMLDQRAEYEVNSSPGDLPDGVKPSSVELKEAGPSGFRNGPVPVRTRGKVATAWINRHEIASHDYFWGAWITLVIDEPQWVLSRPGATPPAQAIIPVDAPPKVDPPKPKYTAPRLILNPID